MRMLAALVLATTFAVSTSLADSPAMEFDVVSTVAVREVVPADGSFSSADEKLIAIHLQVSTYVSPQSRSDVRDVVFSFDNAANDFQIVDFFPKTTLDSRFAGPISMHETDERQFGIDFDATGLYKSLTGTTLAGPAITGTLRDNQQRKSEFQLVPPKEVVAASGTIQRGRGVYFKLKPSPNETLEGAKDFLIVARVPATWRGDLARLRCEANGESVSVLSFESSQQLAERDFLLGLHLEGDSEAKHAAERFVASEQWLRRVAREQKGRRAGSPKLLQTFGIAPSPVSAHWLNDWLYGPAKKEVAERLPEPVRKAALQYAAARSELHRLSGKDAPRVAARAGIAD